MKKLGKGIGRFFIIILSTVVFLSVTLLLVINMLCNGPSGSAKQMFVTTILETGQLKFLVSWFLSPEEIQELVDSNSLAEMNAEVDVSLIEIHQKDPENKNDTTGEGKPSLTPSVVPDETKTTPIPGEPTQPPVPSDVPEHQDEQEDYDWDAVTVETISSRTFSATMIIVNDPSRVFVGTTYPWGEKGKTLDAIVKQYDALGGVNGGLYNSYDNTGSNPFGVAVSNGEIQYNKPSAYTGLYMIGFNEDSILIIKSLEGMNSADFEKYVAENRIRDAVCFQEEASDKNNHFVSLVINGEAREMNGMGSGLNPRTAIGQRADGAILLLVTDGRGSSGHLGASASDLIDIMLEYGAVNAANLDGGSSSCMYYDDEFLMTSTTFYYANSSWRLPTAFLFK